MRIGRAKLIVACAAVAAIVTSVWMLERSAAGLEAQSLDVEQTPVSVLAPRDGPRAPAVVIAHGFAGSRQLMASIATTLAQSGYVSVSFDFAGHGRNPRPMSGDITAEDGARLSLQAELDRVIAWARTLPQADGRVAVLGHSMASDIIVRAARADPGIAATVAISMFSQQVAADSPENLLMIVGGWEGFLADQAMAILRRSYGDKAAEGVTYRDVETGSRRRFVIADSVEHVGVLYSRETLGETVGWLNTVFGRSTVGPIDVRGP